MIGIKDHEYCLYIKHYKGKFLGLPKLKTKCAECIREKKEIADLRIKKSRRGPIDNIPYYVLLRRERQRQYKHSERGKESIARYRNSVSYAKDLLMLSQWKGGRRNEIPDELAEIKLLMIKLKRIGKKDKSE